MRNRQIHNDTGIFLTNTWIKTQFKTFYAKLKDSQGAKIGRKISNKRLWPRFPQNILLTDNEDSQSEDEDHSK